MIREYPAKSPIVCVRFKRATSLMTGYRKGELALGRLEESGAFWPNKRARIVKSRFEVVATEGK